MSRLSIYYGRVRYIEPRPGQETLLPPREPIREAVDAARTVDRYRHEWVLANLETDEDAHLITGRLGYPGTEEVVREDLEAGSFVQRRYELPGAVSSLFVLDSKTGAIAFERIQNKISANGFMGHFVALLNSAGRGQFEGELIRLASNYREFLNLVDKVTRVSFEVRPTNPRDREIFRPLDRGMKASNAKRERVYIENEDEGLSINPPATRDEATDNPAVMGIEMNEEGYGDGYKIDGERDGRSVRFASKGGGLLRDVIEDAPDDAEARTDTLREHLDRRSDFLQPGQTPAPPVPVRDGEDADDEDDDDDLDEDDDDDREDANEPHAP